MQGAFSQDQVKVLIADHAYLDLRILEYNLLKLGIKRIEKALNAMTATHLLSRDTWDLVITELYLPQRDDGLEWIERTRRRFHRDELPILVLSKAVDPQDVTQAMVAGINGFLVKPVSADALQAQLLTLFQLQPSEEKRCGAYLVDRGIIRPQQLDFALKYQQVYAGERVPLSAMALYLNFIHHEQLARLMTHAQFDEALFLEMALDEGLLNPEQCKTLQDMKRYARLRLGDILVLMGFVSRGKLEVALKAFKP